MIIKNEFFQNEKDYLIKQREGLNKAIENWDKRFQKDEVERETFLRQNIEFAKRQGELNKKIEKFNKTNKNKCFKWNNRRSISVKFATYI